MKRLRARFQTDTTLSRTGVAPTLRRLKTIQTKGEKVIAFCEFREIQRLLQHYIEADCRFKADIVDGDSGERVIAPRDARVNRPGFRGGQLV